MRDGEEIPGAEQNSNSLTELDYIKKAQIVDRNERKSRQTGIKLYIESGYCTERILQVVNEYIKDIGLKGELSSNGTAIVFVRDENTNKYDTSTTSLIKEIKGNPEVTASIDGSGIPSGAIETTAIEDETGEDLNDTSELGTQIQSQYESLIFILKVLENADKTNIDKTVLADVFESVRSTDTDTVRVNITPPEEGEIRPAVTAGHEQENSDPQTVSIDIPAENMTKDTFHSFIEQAVVQKENEIKALADSLYSLVSGTKER
jgi:hypothetical protein